jgi:hypothetical protein
MRAACMGVSIVDGEGNLHYRGHGGNTEGWTSTVAIYGGDLRGIAI